MNGTLLMLTFDEDETYTEHNTVFTILIGGPGVLPDNTKGTTDNTFYNHYSTISTVALNWGLPQLGRWDCNANVFAVVANKTGYTNAKVDTSNLYYNASYPGPISDTLYISSWPAPDANATCASGKGVVGSVKSVWGSVKPSYNYNVAGTPNSNASGTSNGTGSSTNGTAASTTSKTATAASYGVSVLVLMVASGMAVFLL
jgi:acid phosphatase